MRASSTSPLSLLPVSAWGPIFTAALHPLQQERMVDVRRQTMLIMDLATWRPTRTETRRKDLTRRDDLESAWRFWFSLQVKTNT